MGTINEIQDLKTFETEVLQSELPVLVDFWAPWCGPCVGLTPTIEALAAEYVGKVKVVKVNVDSADEVAAHYGIRSIPALYFFKGGRVINQMVGARPKPAIKSELDTLL